MGIFLANSKIKTHLCGNHLCRFLAAECDILGGDSLKYLRRKRERLPKIVLLFLAPRAHFSDFNARTSPAF